MQFKLINSWAKSLLQPVTYVGILTVLIVCFALADLTKKQESTNFHNAVTEGDNLSLLLERQVSSTIDEADSGLLLLRSLYQNDPKKFSLNEWVHDTHLRRDINFKIEVAGAGGLIDGRNFSPAAHPTYFGGLESFATHAHSLRDELYIGVPKRFGASGSWSIELARRITNSDGSLGGIVTAQLDPHKFIPTTVRLRNEDVLTILGLDGQVEIRYVNGKIDESAFGKSLGHTTILRQAKERPFGHFWSSPEHGIDHIKRLIHYRVVKGRPLAVVFGQTERSIAGGNSNILIFYYGIGGFLTFAVLVAIAISALRERRLAEAMQAKTYAVGELAEKQFALDQAAIVAVTDAQGEINYVNDRFCDLSGYSREESLGRNCRILNSGFHLKSLFWEMRRKITAGGIWRGELCNRAKNGSVYWVDTTIVPKMGPDQRPLAYTAIQFDVTARKMAEEKIYHMARHDELTGLGNRAMLLERSEALLMGVEDIGDTFALLLLDLDGFKNVNDTLGHGAGDKLLMELSERMKSALCGDEYLARLGGDEFSIIQGNRTNQREDATNLAVKLLNIVSAPFELDGHSVIVGTSIGIVIAPHDGVTIEELLKKADLALYRVKSQGRNNFRFFDNEMSKRVTERELLLADMRAALTRNEFELHYQLVFDAKTGRPCGAEALVRWHHPVKGLMPPDLFIPIAEEADLMEPLGAWVLERACKDAALWPEAMTVAVNLSATQLAGGRLLDILLCALTESGLSPERLELEITESVFMKDDERNRSVIQQLKNIGVSIALDDFGTGYSSLRCLMTFPFDKIKIDKSFTEGLVERADCAAIVASVLTLARGLDISVTAEGVETKDQLELLRVAGVPFVQGYLFARPCPLHELKFADFESDGQAGVAA